MPTVLKPITRIQRGKVQHYYQHYHVAENGILTGLVHDTRNAVLNDVPVPHLQVEYIVHGETTPRIWEGIDAKPYEKVILPLMYRLHQALHRSYVWWTRASYSTNYWAFWAALAVNRNVSRATVEQLAQMGEEYLWYQPVYAGVGFYPLLLQARALRGEHFDIPDPSKVLQNPREPIDQHALDAMKQSVAIGRFERVLNNIAYTNAQIAILDRFLATRSYPINGTNIRWTYHDRPLVTYPLAVEGTEFLWAQRAQYDAYFWQAVQEGLHQYQQQTQQPLRQCYAELANALRTVNAPNVYFQQVAHQMAQAVPASDADAVRELMGSLGRPLIPLPPPVS